MFYVQISIQESYADNENYIENFLSQIHHYDLNRFMLNDINDGFDNETSEKSHLHIDFSIQDTIDSFINYRPLHISGSIEINGVVYENIHGELRFDRYIVTEFFRLYDSENHNILNFATTDQHEYFVELSGKEVEDIFG